MIARHDLALCEVGNAEDGAVPEVGVTLQVVDEILAREVLLRHRPLDHVLEPEVTVRIDLRGHDGLARQVDARRAGRDLQLALPADAGELVVLDDEDGVLDGCGALTRDEPRSLKCCRARRPRDRRSIFRLGGARRCQETRHAEQTRRRPLYPAHRSLLGDTFVNEFVRHLTPGRGHHANQRGNELTRPSSSLHHRFATRIAHGCPSAVRTIAWSTLFDHRADVRQTACGGFVLRTWAFHAVRLGRGAPEPVAAQPVQTRGNRRLRFECRRHRSASTAGWMTKPGDGRRPRTDFVQVEPVEGAPPTDPMEVRFLYDDDALFVGARMFTRAPSEIQAPLSRRDEGTGQAEHVFVSLDTYLDRRTAYTFGVTAAGARFDHYHADDDRSNTDPGFDPVWEARVGVDEDGWIAELRIPFNQLRFTNTDAQVWGLNIYRLVPGRNEEVYWSLLPRTEEVWASRFGELHGIVGIRPTSRLELLPYVAGSSTLAGSSEQANPFDAGLNLVGGAGLDMKMGLGPNLTLEATINPDFGQIEADPAEVNLTAFETFFDERRPFFLEGSQLLAGESSDDSEAAYFYSRRIGAPPAESAVGDFVEHPSTTTTLGAAKLTGRLPTGTSIGVLGALTTAESARTYGARKRGFQPGAGGTVDDIWGGPSAAGVRAGGIDRGLHGDGSAPQPGRRRSTGLAPDEKRVQRQRRLAAAIQGWRIRNRDEPGSQPRRRRSASDRQDPRLERPLLPASGRTPRHLRSQPHVDDRCEGRRDGGAQKRTPLALAGGDGLRLPRVRGERCGPIVDRRRDLGVCRDRVPRDAAWPAVQELCGEPGKRSPVELRRGTSGR